MGGDSIQSEFRLAEEHFRAGRLGDAEKVCRQILEREPEHRDALNLLSIALRQQGNISGAIEIAARAVKFHPDVPYLHANLGEFLRVAGDLNRATESFQKAVALNPNEPTLHNGLGMAFTDQRRHDLAAKEFRRAIELKPDYAIAHDNLGGALREMDQLDEAAAEIETALRIRPRFAQALSNLAIVRTDQGRFAEAAECYERAIAIRPEYADAHWSLGTLCLLRGEMERGWREFQWRPSRAPIFSSPIWKGEEIGGKTIILYAEQGLGDTIQFVRYVPMLRQRGADVWLASQGELFGLLGNFVRILKPGQPIPRHDFQCPLMDLAMIVGGFAGEPYLKADDERSRKWAVALGERKGKARVGLVWAGGAGHRGDARRSIRLESLKPLLELKNLEFFSLQKGPQAIQAAGLPVTDLSPQLHDFSETAAVIEQLDLVISVDTAVAHLAGAMGKPVWVLLPQVPDWRWQLEGERTPWYPTMRLLRQKVRGDWAEPISRAAAELARWERPIELNESAEGHAERGARLIQSRDFDGAIAACRKAIELNPNLAAAHNNLGACLRFQGKFEEATEACTRAIEIRPDYASALTNLGAALAEIGQVREALPLHERAIALEPQLAAAHWNLAMASLRLGDLKRGFEEYEWRLVGPTPVLGSDISQPRWDGSPLDGKTILLHGEQGIGDIIHFVRYAPMVAARGGKIVIICHKELCRLLESMEGIGEVISFGAPLPQFDVYCPLMSLAKVFGTTLETIPAGAAYLHAPAELARKWGERLGPKKSNLLRVGLVWAGRAEYLADQQRSIRLEQLGPLAAIEGIEFHSLQKGAGAQQADNPPAGMRVINHGQSLMDFADTAGLMANLDLIISVDTAAAHLAGAMGKRVWVLVPTPADWRWMLDGEETKWYPTMKLFRQNLRGQWDDVIGRIANALATGHGRAPAV